MIVHRNHRHAAVPLAALASLVIGCADEPDLTDYGVDEAELSSVAGPITRAEILARAKRWADLGVPYSQDQSHPVSDGTGGAYRSDCSGYVSMAWHLAKKSDGWDFNTNDFGSSPLAVKLGSFDELQGGDAINGVSYGHIVLFDRWADSAHTAMWIYQEPTFGQTAEHVMRSRAWYVANGFRAIRYKHLVTALPRAVAGDTGAVVSARNADGRLEVFWIGGGGAILHAWQTVTNGAWSHAAALGGKAKQLAVAANQDGRIELAYVGTDDKLYHRYQTVGGWSNEYGFGVAATTVAIGRNADGRLELFYAGSDGTVRHVWQKVASGGWGDHVVLGGKARDIRVGANSDGRLEVMYIGTDAKLYHRWQTTPNGSWSQEASLAGAASSFAVSRNADGRLELAFANGASALHHLWQKTPSSAWGDDAPLGGAAKQVALAANRDGRLEAFYVGTDGKLYHRWQTTPNGSWSHEAAFGRAGTQVAVGRNADGRLELFYVMPDGRLAHLWQSDGAWTGGAVLGNGTANAPALDDLALDLAENASL